jgi:adenosine deaminase
MFHRPHPSRQAHRLPQPDHALAGLYHVGESFTDKTIESAIRWVHEAAEAGAHRLGHAIALGVEPHSYGPHTRHEIEVCPASNRRIGNIADPAAHPVHRFLATGVPTVIATDDPGLFDVTLAEELDWVCTHTGGGDMLRRQLERSAWASRSERLTGRPD